MASASAISLTGMMALAPWCSAVTNVLVARSTSNTTHAVARKSRWASAGNSAGVRMVSIFILRRAKDAKAAKKICRLAVICFILW